MHLALRLITSGGRQTKFPLLRRSNLSAAPGVICKEASYVKVESEQDFIELVELERISEGLPCAGDVGISVSFRAQCLSGVLEETWLGRTEIEEFTSAIGSLEETGLGDAELTSLSPDEFTFEVRAMDKPGRVLVKVSLQSGRYIQSERESLLIKGSFEIELSQVTGIRRCFSAFVSQ